MGRRAKRGLNKGITIVIPIGVCGWRYWRSSRRGRDQELISGVSVDNAVKWIILIYTFHLAKPNYEFLSAVSAHPVVQFISE